MVTVKHSWRQAIITRYHGPTNFRGSRVTATASAGKATVAWDHALSADENHAEAAKLLCEKFDWTGTLVGGTLADGDRVWTFEQTPREAEAERANKEVA